MTEKMKEFLSSALGYWLAALIAIVAVYVIDGAQPILAVMFVIGGLVWMPFMWWIIPRDEPSPEGPEPPVQEGVSRSHEGAELGPRYERIVRT